MKRVELLTLKGYELPILKIDGKYYKDGKYVVRSHMGLNKILDIEVKELELTSLEIEELWNLLDNDIFSLDGELIDKVHFIIEDILSPGVEAMNENDVLPLLFISRMLRRELRGEINLTPECIGLFIYIPHSDMLVIKTEEKHIELKGEQLCSVFKSEDPVGVFTSKIIEGLNIEVDRNVFTP